jgi:ubiquinone biosynthesis monooxygenase Coq7
MMEVTARLAADETLGDRVIKVNHAGEHGAVNIYRLPPRVPYVE